MTQREMEERPLELLPQTRATYWNRSTTELIELALLRREVQLAANGALVARTGPHTGRSADDKYLVENELTRERAWWNKLSKPMPQEIFDRLFSRAAAYLQGREVFVTDAAVGADPRVHLTVRVITEYAWHALFARQLLRRLLPEDQARAEPEWTVLGLPGFHPDPQLDGTRSNVAVAIDMARRLVLICGTAYAGEIKKALFTVMNFVLPERGIFPMHCSANTGPAGDVALFFGLSGTGKTSLSADLARGLIGDDEHGWSDYGVFNFEGGCYAKCIRLSARSEPQIFNAVRFGSVIENVVIDPLTRLPDYDDASLTENTRAAYPLDYIDNAIPSGTGAHPNVVFFLTADAFGVLPPIAALTPEQAMYHFLSGYTARMAGTEVGLGSEPKATFSTCFGAPFMPLPPRVYAELLGQKLRQHDARVYLVNTGWTGGPYGVGSRIDIDYTRAMIHAAMEGRLEGVELWTDPAFGLHVPVGLPGVPPQLLRPRETWPDPAAYDEQARRVARLFVDNFQQFAATVSPEVVAAGPRA
jgi:phosphoenolpyruvate carboxykinase (ATP)